MIYKIETKDGVFYTEDAGQAETMYAMLSKTEPVTKWRAPISWEVERAKKEKKSMD